jgi:hypothetical protein
VTVFAFTTSAGFSNTSHFGHCIPHIVGTELCDPISLLICLPSLPEGKGVKEPGYVRAVPELTPVIFYGRPTTKEPGEVRSLYQVVSYKQVVYFFQKGQNYFWSRFHGV